MPDENATTDRLVLDGALTLRRADAIHASLLEATARATDLVIDCSQATDVDLSLLQLLIAARSSAVRSGGSVTFPEPPDGPLGAALTRAGFTVVEDNQLGSVNGFWFDGGKE